MGWLIKETIHVFEIAFSNVSSVNRFGDLLDFGQLFKAFGYN